MNSWLERLLLLLIFSLGFMRPSIRFSGMSLQATEILFLTAALLYCLALFFRRRAITWETSYVFFASFAASMALSAAFSENIGTSALKLLAVCYLAALSLLTVSLVTTAGTFRRVVYVWLSGSTLASLIGVITVAMFYIDRDSAWNGLFLHHYGSLPEGNYPRIQSTFIYPAMLCNYLTVGTVLAVGAWKDGLIGRSLAAIIFLVHLIAAAFTVTPGLGGYVFAVGSTLGWYLMDNGSPLKGRISLLFGIAAALLFTVIATVSIWPISTSPYTLEVFGRRLDPTQRLLAWQAAVRTFITDPIFGKGIGTGAVRVLFQAPSGQMQMLTDAHNTWLNVAAQSGIVGLSAVIALSFHVISRGKKAVEAVGEFGWTYRSLLIAFVSCFIVQGLVGSFEDSRHLWILMGLLMAGARIRREVTAD